MTNKESLRTFIYRAAGGDAEKRISLLKHLAPKMKGGVYLSDVQTTLSCKDGGSEYVLAWKYIESENPAISPGTDLPPVEDKDVLQCYVVRSYPESEKNTNAYQLLVDVFAHLRQMLADELDTVDFEGFIRHAYILEDDKAKWELVAEAWRQTESQNPAKPLVDVVTSETSTERNRRRYQACIDAGLQMPDNDYAVLPNGINSIAAKEGISKQAFSKSVKSHIRTLRS